MHVGPRISEWFVRGLDLPALPKPPDYPPQRAACALCHVPVVEGYPTSTLIKPTTADLADTFGSADWVCEICARAFVQSKTLASNLYADANGALKPMIAQASATPERPSWRDLLRALPFGTPCVAVVTSNTKRRLWPRAPISAFGEQWRPLFVDGDTDRVLRINADALLTQLAFVEYVYSRGFSKPIIASSLYLGLTVKRIREIGHDTIRNLEDVLSRWRGSDEFLLALFIAQKEETAS